MRPSPEAAHSDVAVYRRALLHAKPFWPRLVVVLILGLLATPIGLLMPLPLKIIVDNVVGDHSVPQFMTLVLPASVLGSKPLLLAVAAALQLAVATLTVVQGLGSWLVSEYTGEQMVLRLRSELFQQAQRLSLSYHDEKGLADATYRIQYDAPSLCGLIVWGMIPFISAMVNLGGIFYVTARASLLLAVLAIAVSPVVALLTWIYSRRLTRQWQHVKALETTALSVIQEVLSAIRVVKAFGQEDRELHRFVDRSRSTLTQRVRVILTESALSLSVGVALALGTVAVLVVGSRQVLAGELTLGTLLVVVAYVTRLYDPLYTIGKQLAEQRGSLVGVRRAFSLLDMAPAIEESKTAKPISRTTGHVVFRDVSFAYPGGPRVLHDVSFEVAAGSRVAVVGPTGSGKTTLMTLLTRFYDPVEGRILLDGIDLRAYRIADLRDQFAIVLQEPVLFSTTIAENIAYARADATAQQVRKAAQAANAHEFISRLPEGYDTVVGERGAKLSGGERQRIALARAFLKNAPILILDEPTSAVDTKTETVILGAIEKLMAGRTTFMIAHRLAPLGVCDVRLSVVAGRLHPSADVERPGLASSALPHSG